jgi:hypothetical protein
VSIRFSGGLIFGLVDVFACSRPLPYDCVVKPRFPEVESILAEERERFGL